MAEMPIRTMGEIKSFQQGRDFIDFVERLKQTESSNGFTWPLVMWRST
jgi:hypothetical protein